MENRHRTLQEFREAIRKNEIAFPSPAPRFPRQCKPELQWRAAELFLIHGWTCSRLAARYGVTRGRVWLLIRSWIDRALALGYLQDIPPADAPMAPQNRTSALDEASSSLLTRWPPTTTAASNDIHMSEKRGDSPWPNYLL
jgi:hypothetical protein